MKKPIYTVMMSKKTIIEGKSKVPNKYVRRRIELKGCLQMCDDNGEWITFNPTSILFDLHSSQYASIYESLHSIKFPNDYLIECGFGKDIIITEQKKYARVLRDVYRILFEDKRTIDLYMLSKLISFYEITMDYVMVYSDLECTYNNLLTERQMTGERLLHYQEMDYTELLSICLDDEKDFFYCYDCYSTADIIFAILHFLAVTKHTHIKKCEHCTRLFFYKNNQQRYCTRNSIFENYEHLPCEQAVRNILQRSQRTYRKLYNAQHIERNVSDEDFLAFQEEFAGYKSLAKKCSSVGNLSKLLCYIQKDYQESKWYKNLQNDKEKMKIQTTGNRNNNRKQKIEK